MKYYSILCILLVPATVSAQEVSFLVDEVFASSPVEAQETDIGSRATRQHAEKSQFSSSDNLLEEQVATESVEISPSSSDSSASSIPFVSSASSASSASSLNTEEQDRLTLQELEEYAEEAQQNAEEQLTLLEEGFTITSTSSLGSPLSGNQRAAILRRTVRTVPQLKLFARALAESDENLRKISISSDGISMSYRRKAHLFGFLPLHYILNVHVQDGVVTAEQPWWHVVARDGVEEVVDSLREGLSPDDAEQSALQYVQQLLLSVTNILSGNRS